MSLGILFYSFVPQLVYASTYVPVVSATSSFIAGATYLGETLGPVLPEVALVAGICVAGGMVYQNREQVMSVAGSIYQNMIKAGYTVTKVGADGYSLAKGGLDFITSDIASLNSSKSLNIPYGLAGANPITVPFATIFGITFANNTNILMQDPSTKINHFALCPNAPFWLTVVATTSTQLHLILQRVGVNDYDLGWLNKDTNAIYTPVNGASISADLTANNFSKTQDVSICPPYVADKVITIPKNLTYPKTSALPISASGDIASDWAGDLVGTSDYTKAFPKTATDTPTIDTPNTSTFPWLSDILDWLKKIWDAIKAIPTDIIKFFTIDWALVTPALDFSDIWKTHFKPFYDISDALSTVNSSPESNAGKFFMDIPKVVGGDGLRHCVLDLTVASSPLTFCRTFLKYFIWLGLAFYIFRLFEPKITIN